jgi:hypothetical protein
VRRVEEDLAAGRRDLARQWLAGLVGSFPARLDLRRRLAEVYRADGDLAQAGRWAYLEPDRHEREVEAFERAYGDPLARMRALRWRGPEDASGPEVEARLRALREQAEAATGAPVSWERPRWPETGPSRWEDAAVGAGCVMAAVLAVLLLIGAGSLVGQGVHVVRRWVS